MVHCLRIVAMTLLVAPPWHVLWTGQRVNGMLSVQYCTDSIALRYVKKTSQNHELSLKLSKICLNGYAVFSLSADILFVFSFRRHSWISNHRFYTVLYVVQFIAWGETIDIIQHTQWGWWNWVRVCACKQYHKERIGSMSCRTVFKKAWWKKL